MTTEMKLNASAFVKNDKPRRRGPQAPTNKARNLREAVILAAEAVGEDGRGHNGVVGYLKNAAVEEPKAYLKLFAKILPMQNIEVNNNRSATLTRSRRRNDDARFMKKCAA